MPPSPRRPSEPKRLLKLKETLKLFEGTTLRTLSLHLLAELTWQFLAAPLLRPTSEG